MDKLAFANWVIEHKLGDFCQEDTDVFISELYVPTVGEAVMVPVAELVDTDEDGRAAVVRRVFAEAGLAGEALEARVRERLASTSGAEVQN